MERSEIWKHTLLFSGCLGLVFLAAGIGSMFTAPAIDSWYAGLEKPGFNPPNWVFGPVWTVLYTLIGVSLFLILRTGWNTAVKHALIPFTVQLILNTSWSIVFFGLQQIGAAFLVILALIVSIGWTMKRFYPVSRNATYLLVPYLAWVLFATVLNAAIYTLN